MLLRAPQLQPRKRYAHMGPMRVSPLSWKTTKWVVLCKRVLVLLYKDPTRDINFKNYPNVEHGPHNPILMNMAPISDRTGWRGF